jgi:hypothetical protein
MALTTGQNGYSEEQDDKLVRCYCSWWWWWRAVAMVAVIVFVARC